MLHANLLLGFLSTLKMEAAFSSETLADFSTACRPDDRTLLWFCSISCSTRTNIQLHVPGYEEI
jgi:hypothetical protein